MCRSRWNAQSLDDDNYCDYFRWGCDCFGCVCLACNSPTFDCAAVSSCVAMSRIDRHKKIVVVAVAAGGGVYHRFCSA